MNLSLADTSSLAVATVKVFGALLVVVGLMLLVLYLIKRAGLASGGAAGRGAISVLETRLIAPKKYIAVVEVAGRCLAVGITDNAITLLAELGAEEKASLARNRREKASPFAALLNRRLAASGAEPEGRS